LWATPNSGFSVEVKREDDGRVEVEFESDEHESEIEAWWDGTAVRYEVEEKAR